MLSQMYNTHLQQESTTRPNIDVRLSKCANDLECMYLTILIQGGPKNVCPHEDN